MNVAIISRKMRFKIRYSLWEGFFWMDSFSHEISEQEEINFSKLISPIKLLEKWPNKWLIKNQHYKKCAFALKSKNKYKERRYI